MEKYDFYRDIENYVLVGNKIYRREFSNRAKLNPNAIDKGVFKSKFNFTESDYQRLIEFSEFTCKASHVNYEQVVDGDKWNTYQRISWTPKEGEWPTIKKLIDHLYGDNGIEGDQTEELYDYHTIMLKHPEQRLFGRIIYSYAQGTSKSTLGELERLMFSGNYCKVRDEEFEDKFNELWASALIIHLDEPMFSQKKKMSRKIRDMITAHTVNVRRMQTASSPQPFFAKFLITSNDSDFMPIEKSDRRYWVREVTKISNENDDPHFIDKMISEIDYYIHFLLHREMKYPEKVDGTFWLPQSTLKTYGMKTFVHDNATTDEQQVLDWLSNYFLSHKNKDHVTFTLTDLQNKINWEENHRPSAKRIGVILRNSLGIEPVTNVRRLQNGENYIIKDPDGDYPAARYWKIMRSQVDLHEDLFDQKSYTV
jgi:hypothetical protein